MAELKTVYFKNRGDENTDDVLRICKQRADELGIKTVVVASTSGKTAVKAVNVFAGMKVVAVSRSVGFKEPNVFDFKEDNRKLVEGKGGVILTTAHAFGGLSRSMRQSSVKETPATYVVGDLVASTLRVFGDGMKVVCEVAVMAADAGLVRTDEEVISIGGTGRAGGGADTAAVVQPANAHRFFEFRVKELLCKPRL